MRNRELAVTPVKLVRRARIVAGRAQLERIGEPEHRTPRMIFVSSRAKPLYVMKKWEEYAPTFDSGSVLACNSGRSLGAGARRPQ